MVQLFYFDKSLTLQELQRVYKLALSLVSSYNIFQNYNVNEIRYLDCYNWLKYRQNGSFLPLNIAFGGYKRDRYLPKTLLLIIRAIWYFIQIWVDLYSH